MNCNSIAALLACGLSLTVVCAPQASAQENLPFPPTPSASTAGLSMQDSVYKKRVDPQRYLDILRRLGIRK